MAEFDLDQEKLPRPLEHGRALGAQRVVISLCAGPDWQPPEQGGALTCAAGRITTRPHSALTD